MAVVDASREQPRRPRRRPGENRERLLEAGIGEFGMRGYRGASTAAIAASAGVPQPHVYASFPAKRDLFLACAARVIDELACGGAGAASAAFLFQAVSSLNDEELRDELLPAIRDLRGEIGDVRFSGLLTKAAAAALG